MLLKDFKKAIDETPHFVPLFRITKVPTFAKEHIAKGDFVIWYNGGFITQKNIGLRLGASCVEFLDYMTSRQFFAFSAKELASFHFPRNK